MVHSHTKKLSWSSSSPLKIWLINQYEGVKLPCSRFFLKSFRLKCSALSRNHSYTHTGCIKLLLSISMHIEFKLSDESLEKLSQY